MAYVPERRSPFLFRFAAFAMMISCPLLAVAQDQSATNFLPLRIPLEPPESLPPSGTEGGHLFNLRPLGADFERTLANYGIHLQARDLSEVLSDVGGGVSIGVHSSGYTRPPESIPT